MATAEISGDVTISATAAEVMAVLVDVEQWPNWSPGQKKVTVETKHADGLPAQCRMTVSAGPGITDDQLVTFDWAGDEVSWTLVKSSQQRSQEAHFRLHPSGANTEVHFEMQAKPKVPVPAFIVKQRMKKGLEASMTGLKKQVESNRRRAGRR